LFLISRAKRGQHWTALYSELDLVSGKPNSSFFCSYGNSFTLYNFDIPTNIVFVNKKLLQSLESFACGIFSLYYLVHRIKGASNSQILDQFGPDLDRNEQLVVAWYQRIKTRNPYSEKDNQLQGCCTRLVNRF